ncbi:MAG TPA: hypothetical protein PK691_10355, partial [Thermomicrobiales bacterium]|nr:hypothetical protein [Thermomicrobiales bacterium]
STMSGRASSFDVVRDREAMASILSAFGSEQIGHHRGIRVQESIEGAGPSAGGGTEWVEAVGVLFKVAHQSSNAHRNLVTNWSNVLHRTTDTMTANGTVLAVARYSAPGR